MIGKILKVLLATALSVASGKHIIASEIAFETQVIPSPWKYFVSMGFVLSTILCACLALQCLRDAFPEPEEATE